ncbi:putative flavin-containing monooxygenase [Gordonia effusa NBRC 100432]|uniref:Putative flavin-containing monooxygenase n=1 Tax=Gordonia effusa NBRC 100432 TaxID=1077974 RepID=H0QUZ8_9ACTN|nr:NAD(P)/FAD-dependent oxidoreductase [Gordonia effusa]GAB16649.1 putative flavin-containing monooxygenase [Gordonia effusa NBRC 100432]
MSRRREPRIVVIGAGVAGIATAHALEQAGFSDYLIVEKGTDVGGVWYWNHYPGLTCDVPSQIYQFSFAPKADWKRIWATGPEIQQYHRDVVEELGIVDRIRFGTEVVASVFNDETGEWTVTTRPTGASGTESEEELTVDFVICATGVLHNPAIPDIPGLGDFSGPVVHTARWDDDLVTDGRRVAVLGTGSTGVQVVSALQKQASSVTHFVRAPQWVLWAPMWLPQLSVVSKLLGASRNVQDRVYQLLLRGSGILADVVLKPTWRRRAVQAYARISLRGQVFDEELRTELTPDYQPLCKRQVISGTYYRALRAPNTELVTAGIEKINETGIVTVDGRQHDVDIIVLATGFRAHDYMRPMRVVGRDGLTLDDAWAGGPRAYRMTAIPGFPNLFTVLGPNSPTGSISLQFSAELTAKYIVKWLERFAAGNLDSVEVTEDATAQFNSEVAQAMGPTVWNTGCNSWYLTESGSVDLWPFDRATMRRMLGTPQDEHFVVTQSRRVAGEQV